MINVLTGKLSEEIFLGKITIFALVIAVISVEESFRRRKTVPFKNFKRQTSFFCDLPSLTTP